MIITIEQVLSWHPCQAYKTEELLLAVSGGRREMELSEVLSLDVPPEDLIWLGCHALPQALRIEFACDCAAHVLPFYESQYPGDRRVREAIEVTRMYNDGLVSDAEATRATWAAWDAWAAWAAEDAARAIEVVAWDAWAAWAAWDAWDAEAAEDAARAIEVVARAAWDATWDAGDARAAEAAEAARAARAAEAAEAAEAAGAVERSWQLERLRYYVSLSV